MQSCVFTPYIRQHLREYKLFIDVHSYRQGSYWPGVMLLLHIELYLLSLT